MAQSRGNFSLLTLWACIVTVGALIALNLEIGSNAFEIGWPLTAAKDAFRGWAHAQTVRIGDMNLNPLRTIFDLVVNIGILSAIAYKCEAYSRRKAQRALLQATLANAPKKSDNFLA